MSFGMVFFEPFLEDIATHVLKWVAAECEERRLSPEAYTQEAASLIKDFTARVYAEMAETDLILRNASGQRGTSMRDVEQKALSHRRKINA